MHFIGVANEVGAGELLHRVDLAKDAQGVHNRNPILGFLAGPSFNSWNMCESTLVLPIKDIHRHVI